MRPTDKTEEYFSEHAEDYAERIMSIQPKLYNNTGKIINSILKENDTVLDIGNGGVINYSFKKLKKLICADLYISERAEEKYRENLNVKFVKQNILNLTEYDCKNYDVIIIQTVLHHLAGKTYGETVENVKRAICESLSILKDKGKIIILESTVSRWFEIIERILYPFMQLFFFICKFGYVYQFSDKSLYELLSKEMQLNIIERKKVEIDKYIWIMNKKISSKITPCGLNYYLIEKKHFHLLQVKINMIS